MLALLAVGFMSYSCSEDDDNDGGGSTGNNSGKTEVVVSQKPAEGWVGSFENGLCTYTPESYEEDEYSQCYAFNFSNGVCNDAAYNVIFENSSTAKIYADMLNSGKWAYEDEDEEDYYSKTRTINNAIINLDILKALRKAIPTNGTRANGLSFNVSRKGNVIYLSLDNYKKLTAEDVKYAIDVNNGEITVPDHFTFGTWDSAKGTYTCNNIYGLGVKYVVNVAFDNNRTVTSYKTLLTFPTTEWAMVMEEMLVEQSYEYIQMFGQAPAINRNGKNITIDAIIIDSVSEENIVKYLILLDYVNNRPLLSSMFY